MAYAKFFFFFFKEITHLRMKNFYNIKSTAFFNDSFKIFLAEKENKLESDLGRTDRIMKAKGMKLKLEQDENNGSRQK